MVLAGPQRGWRAGPRAPAHPLRAHPMVRPPPASHGTERTAAEMSTDWTMARIATLEGLVASARPPHAETHRIDAADRYLRARIDRTAPDHHIAIDRHKMVNGLVEIVAHGRDRDETLQGAQRRRPHARFAVYPAPPSIALALERGELPPIHLAAGRIALDSRGRAGMCGSLPYTLAKPPARPRPLPAAGAWS